MLFLISGAAASGKTTVSRALSGRVEDLVVLQEDLRPIRVGDTREANLELWIEDALRAEAEGRDALFETQAPLGEVLASPRAVELEAIAPCLLDVHDFVRMERWLARGVHPDWPIGMDHFCWAAFHRLHARDPRYEQRVLLGLGYERSVWSRWTGWASDDPRWDVFIYDSSASDFGATVQAVTDWIRSVREKGAPIRREDAWWT